MTNKTSKHEYSFDFGLGELFWLANLIYTVMYWHGWHILWNIFVPYAILVDLIKRFGKL